MKKIIILTLIAFILPGCSILRTHKMDIEQGNVITQSELSRLRPGMTEGQVKEIMGDPVLVNIFSPNRVDYVYTMEKGYRSIEEKRVICTFQHGRLREIQST